MIKLAKPDISEEAIKHVSDVLRSGNLVQGEQVKSFERRLQSYLGSTHVIAVSSGTAALHVSLMSLGLGPGDEIIVPAFTFPATANVVEAVGGKPVFVDIVLDDFCIDTSRIIDAITPSTKAIIPVHEFGHPAAMDEIVAIANKYQLHVIEDAACALGSEIQGQKAGTFGTLGCFSFHPRKAITTGEGGAIVTNDSALAEKVYCLRNHGISAANGTVDFVYPGLNYRMTDFQAVLGNSQFDKFDSSIEHRIQIAKWYNEYLSSNNQIQTPKTTASVKHTYQTYHTLIREHINRDNLILTLKKADIETNIGAQALQCLSYYQKKYSLSENDYPNATKAFRSGLALPVGNHINQSTVQYICHELQKAVNVNGGQ